MLEEIQQFLDMRKQKNCSYHTIKAYSAVLNRFAAVCDKPIKEITKQDILGFIQKEFPNSKERIAMKNYMLKVLHRFFYQNDRNDLCIFIRDIKPKYNHENIEPYTPQEVATAIKEAKTARDRALIALLATSGLRISEALKLRRCDIELDKQTGYVRQGKGRKKGEKKEIFVYSPDARTYLEDYFAEAQIPDKSRILIFKPKTDCAEDIMTSYFAYRYRFKENYGIHAFHRFRHYFGTEASKTLKPLSLKKIMRHKQFTSTEIYITTNDEELVTEYQKNPIKIDGANQ